MRANPGTGIRCLVLLLLGAVTLQGMALRPGSPPVSVRLYGEREGLPNLTIHDVTQGPDGRLWVGTQDGAACFDGKVWTAWHLPFQGGSDWVRAVLPSQDGSVWFGTLDAGLWQWRDGIWVHHDAAKGLPFSRINTLLETRSATGALTLWVGSGGEGLGRWHDGHWDILGTKDGLPSGWIWRLRQAPDPEGGQSIWICTRAGLARWKEGRLLTSPSLGWFQGWETEDILTESGPEGFRATVACWNHGLAEWTGRTWRVRGPSEGFPSLRPICLERTQIPGQAPVAWVGTYNDGLLWRQGFGTWRPLTL
ncbi:MAG: hypothetical protein KGI56_02405, partial [Acidobacteriota bacterium]|nr:hypothetical protein [Acidobacteriota bacterium]